MKKNSVTILDALDDPHLFAGAFRDPRSWAAWRAFLASLFGLPMTSDQLATYRACTGRDVVSTSPATEAWLVCGRRAGKSFALALIAVFLATFRDYRRYLGPGERATIMIIAADRRQARVCMRYIHGLLHAAPMLKRLIQADRQEGIDLSNAVTLEVHAASFRTTRGYSIAAALLDEIAFWPTGEDAASSDAEIVSALRPAMATIPNAVLLCASSPYARRGVLWDAYRKHHGKDGRVLVWQAATRVMNPTVPQSIIDDALRDDPARYGAEYLAHFRSDIEAFVSREIVEACIEPNIRERAPISGNTYRAFVDPSGGSGDSFTLAIGHREKSGMAVLDCIRERKPPFSPEQVVEDYAALLKSFRVTKVVGDRYGGEWPRERFREHGISYECAASPKSDLYRDALPMLASGKAILIDHPVMVSQLVGLERRTARSGRDSIDHAPSGHDDVANVVAGLLVELSGQNVKGYSAQQMIAAVMGPDAVFGRDPYLWTPRDRLRIFYGIG